MTAKSISKLLDRDYKDIDKDLLGTSALRPRHIGTFTVDGYQSAGRIMSLSEMLRPFHPRYRE